MITQSHSPAVGDIPPLVKVTQVATLLSVSRQTVRHLIDSGDLHACDINPANQKTRKHVRVTRVSLLAFYRKRFGHSLLRALAASFEP